MIINLCRFYSEFVSEVRKLCLARVSDTFVYNDLAVNGAVNSPAGLAGGSQRAIWDLQKTVENCGCSIDACKNKHIKSAMLKSRVDSL